MATTELTLKKYIIIILRVLSLVARDCGGAWDNSPIL